MFRRSSTIFALKGVDYYRDRFTNKGTAFSNEERDALGLRGLLPPQIETINDQLDRYWTQFQLLQTPINRYQLLRSILDSNVTLYYALIDKYMKHMLPIIYTPTVGEVCQRYGALYQKDHGLYISSQDIGRVKEVLSHYDRSKVDIIVVTDGSRILGLGDLGANGMGISIGKCSLYVAGAGINPERVLPVMIDCGTDNVELKNDPLYLGQRISRVNDEIFYKLLDEFMASASELWPNAVIQFEDFSNNHCFDMLDRYQMKYRCFNDDIQGTGAVVSAGFVNAMVLSGIPHIDHRIVVFGAGSAAIGVVESIAALCTKKFGNTREDVYKKVWLVDTKGVVAHNRRDDKLQKHKLLLARNDVPADLIDKLTTLNDVVNYVKPTALIGLSGAGRVFSEKMIKFMQTYCERPIIFPLSNPTSKAEVDPTDAYEWTNGQAIIASGSPFPDVIVGSKICRPSQGNNMYVFPGVGLGATLAQPTHITKEVMVTAACKLSDMLSMELMQSQGIVYPPIDEIRNVSKHIAVAVMQQMQAEGTAQAKLPDNIPEMMKYVDCSMYWPRYPPSSMYISNGNQTK